MEITIAHAVSLLAPIQDAATDTGRGGILTTILVIIGLLVVTLLIGLGVTLARRPDKAIEEKRDPTPPPPPR